MAFRPSHIEGIHYLVSKNSGSYPNWGVYLSGSGGSGKLFAEYRINASVSCSVSSSTTFVTGSNYFVDAVFSPLERRNYISIDGVYDAISIPGNGTGSLTTTGSLFLGNLSLSSSQAYSGSIFNTRVYSALTAGLINFKSIAPRINKPILGNPPQALALVVGGGGSGGGDLGISGGGGAGGFVYTFFNLNPGTYTVAVGAGGNQVTTAAPGNNGQTSSLAGIIAYGGGAGGGYINNPGYSGASGGGGGSSNSGATITAGSAIYGSQGNAGGTGGTSTRAGGGGGAGAPGQSSVLLSRGGDGGAGLASSISGVITYYAGGGGGSGFGGIGGTGGIGGGANGNTGDVNGFAATPNTGGGGGGGKYQGGVRGGAGGSGIVIIRYPGPQIATGGIITSVDGDTIHTFTATGSHTFTIF
jgi:hypothetical protein